jgi:hypothetical protein
MSPSWITHPDIGGDQVTTYAWLNSWVRLIVPPYTIVLAGAVCCSNFSPTNWQTPSVSSLSSAYSFTEYAMLGRVVGPQNLCTSFGRIFHNPHELGLISGGNVAVKNTIR